MVLASWLQLRSSLPWTSYVTYRALDDEVQMLRFDPSRPSMELVTFLCRRLVVEDALEHSRSLSWAQLYKLGQPKPSTFV